LREKKKKGEEEKGSHPPSASSSLCTVGGKEEKRYRGWRPFASARSLPVDSPRASRGEEKEKVLGVEGKE